MGVEQDSCCPIRREVLARIGGRTRYLPTWGSKELKPEVNDESLRAKVREMEMAMSKEGNPHTRLGKWIEFLREHDLLPSDAENESEESVVGAEAGGELADVTESESWEQIEGVEEERVDAA